MKYCCSARPTAGPFDFHTHTCYSDGAPDQTPRPSAVWPKRRVGWPTWPLTDHDWMLPRTEREALMDEFGLDVIPACELSAELVLDGRRHIIHIGGHWLSEEDPWLQEILRHNQAQDHESYVKEMLRLCLRCGLDPSREGVERSYQMILERNPHSHHLGQAGRHRPALRDRLCLLSPGGPGEISLRPRRTASLCPRRGLLPLRLV